MKLSYVALGIAGFLICAVFFVPARLLTVLLDDYGVFLLETSGTVWTGSGKGIVAGTPLGMFSWSFAPTRLVQGKFSFDYRMDGEFLNLSGTLTRGIDSIEVRASGHVEPHGINQVLSNYGLEVSGRLTMNLLSLRIDEAFDVEKLSGEIRWEGGKCRYQSGTTTSTIDLPAIVGTLFSRNSNAVLQALEKDSGNKLFEVDLDLATRWTHVSATKRLIDLAEYPWHSEANNDAILFQVSHQLDGVAE